MLRQIRRVELVECLAPSFNDWIIIIEILLEFVYRPLVYVDEIEYLYFFSETAELLNKAI
jgi:hypothetical protein